MSRAAETVLPTPPDVLRHTFDAMSVGVIVLGRDLRINVWNRWVESRSGIAESEAIGRGLDALFPDLANSYFMSAVHGALNGGYPSVLAPSLHAPVFPFFAVPGVDTERMRQQIHVVPLGGASGCLVQVIDANAAWQRESTLKRKHLLLEESLELQERLLQQLEGNKAELQRQVRERTAQLEELAGHVQDLSEHERAQLARELHDELGALMTAIRIDVARLNSQSETTTERHQRALKNIDQAIQIKRRIMEGMRPTLLNNFGVVVAIRELAREKAAVNTWRFGIDLPDEEMPISEQLSITLYRVCQEALTNAAKYAEATEVRLSLRLENDFLVLEIMDNGVGMSPVREGRRGGHGISGMQHRVLARGGTLEIGPASPQGTRVVARIPYQARSESARDRSLREDEAN